MPEQLILTDKEIAIIEGMRKTPAQRLAEAKSKIAAIKAALKAIEDAKKQEE